MLISATCWIMYSCLYIVLWMSSTAAMLFQCTLGGYLLSWYPDCHFSIPHSSSPLPAVVDLGRSIYQTYSLFRSKVVIKHCHKEGVYSLIVNTIKCKEKRNNRDALHTHFTQAYWLLDTLPTIINSWWYKCSLCTHNSNSQQHSKNQSIGLWRYF